jgi:hypothetical protein
VVFVGSEACATSLYATVAPVWLSRARQTSPVRAPPSWDSNW